jgi:hypothetical protein
LTAYVLAANATLRDIGNAGIWGVATARTGGDTIDTNGFKVTIDQDSRYGLSGSTSTTWGNLTINASKGGEIHIDATKVWMIPFNTGSGTLTLGTAVTIGSATGNTIGIYTSLTVAPATTGASGWLKVTNVSGALPSTGTYTQAGFTFTITGAAIRGFIEVNGDEAGTINANRLGTFRVTGEWFELGTTNGSAGQTFQIPTNGQARYAAGVYIEKTVGAGDFEFYPNAGTVVFTGTTVGIGNEATRGKVCWIPTTGVVTLGNGGGTGLNGYVPGTGRRVVIPNIFFENNTTAARTANVIPNSTIATRYDFTTTGGGVLEIDKCNMAWYLSCTQPYSVNISNSCFIDAIYMQEIASPITWSLVGVGNKPTTALLVSPLQMLYCYAGGTMTDCNFARVSLAASGAYTVVLTDVLGINFTRCTFRANTIQGNATVYSIFATRVKNCEFVDTVIIEAAVNLTTCDDVNFTNTVYCNCVSGTTVTTYAVYVWNISSNTINCTFSGLTWPVTNTHPYTAILTAATGCAGIKLRNIGTRAAPLTMGSANACGLIYSMATNCSDFKFQRIYVSNTRTGIMTGDNSCHEITEENVFGDYADAVDVMACLNMKRKGMGGTGALTGQTSVYGTHWRDGFTSTTAGRIAILMNEPTSLTTSQVSLTGGAAFTSAGGLYMPTIGQSATFEMPEYILGHTSFQNSALVMAGGTATNYTYDYAIDKNDGNGFSAMTTANYTATTLGTALNGITGIDASLGFKLKLEITTGTTNTTAITSVYVLTNSSTTAQDYQYPLDVNTLELTGLKAGSEVRCYTGSPGASAVEIGGIESSGTSFSFTHSSGGVAGFITIIHPDWQAFNFGIDSAFTYTAADVSLPVSQVTDRNYQP